jgi:16S rRNA (guanine527-N7)-methyltransferase
MLQAFAALVLKWNRQINLISRGTEAEIWQRHIVDSAQLFPLAPEAARLWLDIGSGGGFPGLVIAILAHHLRPDMEVVLVESDKRKAAFLMQAVRSLGLSCRVLAERAESLPPMQADVLSARALAPLGELLGYAARLVGPGGVMIFPKGERAEEEIREACQDWRFGVERIQSATSPAASVLKLTDVHHV